MPAPVLLAAADFAGTAQLLDGFQHIYGRRTTPSFAAVAVSVRAGWGARLTAATAAATAASAAAAAVGAAAARPTVIGPVPVAVADTNPNAPAATPVALSLLLLLHCCCWLPGGVRLGESQAGDMAARPANSTSANISWGRGHAVASALCRTLCCRV
jgi:hypothetical protein